MTSSTPSPTFARFHLKGRGQGDEKRRSDPSSVAKEGGWESDVGGGDDAVCVGSGRERETDSGNIRIVGKCSLSGQRERDERKA